MIVTDLTLDTCAVDTFDVINAEYVSDYKIRISFSDGMICEVDFRPFLLKSLHPSIKKYLDKEKFQTFSIDNGDLFWNDYEMSFPVGDLHDGKI